MKKVLLIGELNEIMRSLNESLMEEFQVQLCSEDVENVKGMVKLTKPDLVVVNQICTELVAGEIFQSLQSRCPETPVLIVCESDKWSYYKRYCESKQFDKLFRPIVKRELLSKCYNMLDMEIGIEEESHDAEPAKIMVVDDNPILLRNIKAMLEDEYTVFLATSGEQALKMIPNKQPDLVLLDYEMPGQDGKETFEAMKENEFACDIPVIFLTGVADKQQIYAVLKHRPAGYILKPPDRERLMDTIREVLKGNYSV